VLAQQRMSSAGGGVKYMRVTQLRSPVI